jgi:hypothetical protein
MHLAERVPAIPRPPLLRGIPPLNQERNMNSEICELDINELDAVVGGDKPSGGNALANPKGYALEAMTWAASQILFIWANS